MQDEQRVVGNQDIKILLPKVRTTPVKKKREYCHISKEKKIQLIKTVLGQKCGIKKVAKHLNINYATAKTILYNYRNKRFLLESGQLLTQVGYACVKPNSKITVRITIDNQIVSQKEYSTFSQ